MRWSTVPTPGEGGDGGGAEEVVHPINPLLPTWPRQVTMRVFSRNLDRISGKHRILNFISISTGYLAENEIG